MDDAQLQRDHALHNQHDEEAAHGEYLRSGQLVQLITSGEHENFAFFEITIQIHIHAYKDNEHYASCMMTEIPFMCSLPPP